MGGVVDSALHAMQEELRQFYEETFLNPDPQAKLEEQLRTLYGRGEINQQRYQQLRIQLRHGMVSKTDLYVIHQEAARRMESDKGSPELEHSLDRLYADRVWVEEARQQLNENTQALRKDVDWIRQQAEAARRDAGAAMPDEAAARSFLEVWQKLLSLSQGLERDLQAMERDMLNLDTLEKEIKAAIIRIKVLCSRERLAKLNQRVRGDLLSQR